MAQLKNQFKTDSKVLVDHALDVFFADGIAASSRISPQYRELWKDMQRLVTSGGKRIRPHMTFLAFEAFGGQDTSHVTHVAAAQELLHQCLLIHDDIIDRDYTRYGVDNIAGSFEAKYQSYVHETTERTHYAHGAAILAGDLLLSGAYKLLALSPLTPDTKAQVQTIFSDSILEVAGGELMDTESAFRSPDEIDTLAIARFKTASYSFTGPLMTGAVAAGAEPATLGSLQKFGIHLGVAFQLKDDLLGVFGDEAITGKSTTSDISEGKYTYLVEQFLSLAPEEDTALFYENFGVRNADDHRIETVKSLLVLSGARDACHAKIDQYEAVARMALEQLPISVEDRRKFEALIDTSLKRDF
ncbi:MAG TPA: polyprenyl synthetase family protein [Candidatus Saccharimonadales bacterium]|jgi:geranylgeranyl diphosphate synthase type II